MEKEGGREDGRWDGRIWFGVADEVDDDDKTQSRQSPFFLPPLARHPPLPPSHPPSCIIHHSPDPPFFALSLCLSSLQSVVSIHMEQRAAAASIRMSVLRPR